LIIGGSQGAQIFSKVVPQAIMLLPSIIQKKLYITQQSRPDLLATTSIAYSKTLSHASLETFFDDMGRLYAEHDLVISRAGASTITELIAFRRPAILVPYPTATDNHQYHNALHLSKSNCALLIQQSDFTPERLAQNLLRLITEPSYLAAMAKCFNTTEALDATERFYNVIDRTLGGPCKTSSKHC